MKEKEEKSMGFEKLGIDSSLCKGLGKEKIVEPTPVQKEVMPKIMEGKNVIVQSQTGSGKTLAYLLPLCMRIQPFERGIVSMVLVPTHELAMQVYKQVQILEQNAGVYLKAAVIVGSVNIKRQIEYLREKPQIVIGTPGRVLELIKKRKIPAHAMKLVVLDEADKLLDKDNVQMTKDVLKCCMRDVQKAMFSASISEKTLKMAKEICPDIERISLSNQLEIPKNIEHVYVVVEEREKLNVLRSLGTSLKPKKSMVFINRAFEIEKIVEKLQYHHYKCAGLYGKSDKKERQKVMREFGMGELQFLVASDIAARGLHFEKVSTVFHLSIPENPMDYLHRAGRAGRGQKRGLSVLIVTKREVSRIKMYEKAFGIRVREL